MKLELDACIPKDKFDKEAIKRARQLGFPTINPILPQLLEWLQDANWPVAEDTADLLSGASSEIVPHIKAIFQSDDDTWKYWILNFLCSRLPQTIQVALRPDIERLAQYPMVREKSEEVDEAAKTFLQVR